MIYDTGSEHWWLRDNKAVKVPSHEEFIKKLIQTQNLKLDVDDAYEIAFQQKFIRVTITHRALYVQTNMYHPSEVKVTRQQKNWLVDKSIEKGFNGVIKDLNGNDVEDTMTLREYFDYL